MKKFSLLIVFLLICFSQTLMAQNADVELAEAINAHPTNFKNSLASITSNSITPVTFGVPVSLLAAGILLHDDNLKKDALYVAGSYLLSSAATIGLKNIFKERRPFDKYPYEVIKRNTTGGGASFPSGHTSAAFNLATSLALRYKKPIVMIPAFLYAGCIGWSRIYQGVHYPSDVLAGAIVGAGTAWLSYKFQKFIDRKKHQQL